MNDSLTEFVKYSGKFDHNINYLKQSLKIFQQYKEEFHNNYASFMEILDLNVEDYKKKIAVCRIHLEYKNKMNDSLTEFFKISGKFGHNIDILKQSLEIFEKYK